MTAPLEHMVTAADMAEDADVTQLAVDLVRLAGAQRAAFLDHLWTHSAETESLDRLVNPADTPKAEAVFRAADASGLAARRAQIEATLADHPPAPLARLQSVFPLSDEDAACLYLALAAHEDPGLSTLFAHVSPEGVDYPTPGLAARLFLGRATSAWRHEGAVARWRLLRRMPMGPGRPDRIVLDAGVTEWLCGREGVAPDLLGMVWPVPTPDPLPEWAVERVTQKAAKLIGPDGPGKVTLLVRGGAQSGRKSFAAAVARGLGLPLLAADLSRVAPTDRIEVLLAMHRHCWLIHAAPIIIGDTEGLSLPVDMAPFPVVFQVGQMAVDPSPDQGQPRIEVSLPMPDAKTRAALWRQLCPGSATWSERALQELAQTHAVPPGAITDIAAHAPASPADAARLLRDRTAGVFGTLARQVECPFDLDDLVLPTQLRRVVETLLHEARVRARLWDRVEMKRLFPGGRGLVALFAGPPGTGKTMGAQVLAAELGLDLFRVDSASLVSKYIGETMENVQRLFDRARETDAMLLFDEADGFFARRTELNTSNDRHANQDTGQLLQAIEAFEGIAVLTSNRRRNIDEAFQRRLRYIVDFPTPDEAARGAIWAKVLATFFGDQAAPLMPGINRIAARIEMTGAQIKQSALTAHFAADRAGGVLAITHLLDGIDTELMKEGRALSPRERADLEAVQ
ncbi:MAG: ATP-binding protein [Sulfitobacter sp.]|uniref:ATP-binding protein n=1 Tax=Sulfitobacter sp. TaxID=1903071 RepID=UPI003299FD4F